MASGTVTECHFSNDYSFDYSFSFLLFRMIIMIITANPAITIPPMINGI